MASGQAWGPDTPRDWGRQEPCNQTPKTPRPLHCLAQDQAVRAQRTGLLSVVGLRVR